MDYGRILTRAWEITWRWKFLWVLGFLVALGNGGGGGSNFRFSGRDLGMGNMRMPDNLNSILALVGCVVFILAIAVWVLSTMARGGLIAGVTQIEDEGSTTLGRAWSIGQHYFWRLFGIGVLAALPIIIIAILIAIAVVMLGLGLGGMAAFAQGNFDRAIGPAVGLALLCIVPLVCVIAILGLVLNQIRLYAERAAILEDLPWIDAFKRGWQVIRANLGPTIIFWLIFLVIGLVLGAIIFGGVIAAAIPFIAMGATSGGNAPNWLFVPICGAILVAVIVGSVIGSVVETFTSATWTLVYRALTNRAAPTPVVAPETEGPLT